MYVYIFVCDGLCEHRYDHLLRTPYASELCGYAELRRLPRLKELVVKEVFVKVVFVKVVVTVFVKVHIDQYSMYLLIVWEIYIIICYIYCVFLGELTSSINK